MSVPFPNQIVWSERFELVEETVYLPARDSWVLGESHELLGRTWLEIIQGHDWELDRHVVWAVVKRTEGVKVGVQPTNMYGKRNEEHLSAEHVYPAWSSGIQVLIWS